MHKPFALVLGFGMALAPVASAAPEAPTHVRAPFIGPEGQIIVPYTDRPPQYRAFELPGKPFRIYVDFDDAFRQPGSADGGAFADSAFASWHFGTPEARTLRLAFKLSEPLHLQVQLHSGTHELWLVPKGGAKRPHVAARPARPVVGKAPTWFVGVRFDPLRQAVALKYRGEAPGYYVDALPPSTTLVEFPHALLAVDESHDHAEGGNPVLSRWSIANEEGAPQTVRLALDSPEPGYVLVALDRAHDELLVLPQRLGLAAQGSTSIAAILETATFDKAADALSVPYYGRAPVPQLERLADDLWYVTFASTVMQRAGVQYGSVEDHPLLSSWFLARVPGTNVARVTMRLAFPGHLEVKDDPANKRLLISPRLGVEADTPSAKPHVP